MSGLQDRKSWLARLGPILLAAMLPGLGACTASGIDVTRRTSLSGVGRDAAFIVLLTDDQAGVADYQHYADLLVDDLRADGLVPASKPADARYAVMLAHILPKAHGGSEDDGSSAADGPISGGRGMGGGHGGSGGGGFGHRGGRGMGGGDSGSDQDVLRIAMFDLTKPRSPEERVFYAEVRAPSDRQSSDMVADMITAALRNFPGKPKESYTEPLPPKPSDGAG